MQRKFSIALTIAMIASMLINSVGFAAVWTDQPDYAPGSVVTISGDNSDGAGFQAGEVVQVIVSGPNGYTSACESEADGNGAWSCQVTLWENELAVGSYNFTATGLNSGFSQSGTFTDAININSFASDCSTALDSFASGATVCAKVPGLGGGTKTGTIKWWAPGLNPSTDDATRSTDFSTTTGNARDTFAPTVCGTWTTKAFVPSGTYQSSDTFEVTGCSTPTPTITTVTFEAGPYVYRGTAFTATAVVTGAGGFSQSVPVVYSGDCINVTSANGCTATATFFSDGSHAGSTDSKSITITKTDPACYISAYTGPYNGGAQGAFGHCVGVDGGILSGLDLGEKFTNVPGGTTNWTFTDGTGNYNNLGGIVAIVINKAPVTATAGSGSATYDGISHSPSACVVSGVYTGDLTCANDPASVGPNVGTTAIAPVVSGTGLGNYDITLVNGSYSIGQASSTTEVTCTAGPFTYNGLPKTPCSVSVTGAGGLSLTPDPVYANNTNAGTASASYTYAGDANHTGSSDSKNFTIGKATSTTVVSFEGGPYTYRGSAFTATANVTGAGGLNAPVTVVYSGDCTNVTVADGCTATATFAGDTNHAGSSDTKSITIDPAPSVTVVSCAAGPFTYDGTAQTPCSVSVTGAGGLSLTPAPVYTNNTNAGTATASYTYAGDANHNGSSDSKPFTIDKAESLTVVSCPTNVTYTGSALTPCSVTVTGAGGLSLTPAPDYSNNTNAGTATASYNYAGDANHNGSSDSKTFTIDKAESLTVVSCPTNVTYTGSALTPCTASVTGAGGLSQSLAVSYSNNTNAGTATASASYAGDANHNGSSDSKTFTIDKASSTTVVTCPVSVTFSGSALTPCTVSVTGVGGLNLTPDPVYTNNTNVGTGTANASYTYAGDANHNGSSDSKTFSILYSTGMCLGSLGHTILQPINADGTSVFKKGSTVPAKFRVCDANGVSIGTPGVVTSFVLYQRINGTESSTVNEVVISTTPDTTFRWSATDQQWIYNINTKNLTAGMTYVYRITLNDGSFIEFQFGLK